MAFLGKTRVFVNEFNLSSYLDQADVELLGSAVEFTTFVDDERKYNPSGVRDGSAMCTGFADGDADAVSEVLDSIFNTAGNLVTICPEGNTQGVGAWLLQAISHQFKARSSILQQSRITGGFRVQKDGIMYGNLAHAQAVRTSAGASNGPNIDLGSGPAARTGMVLLHAFSVTGSTPTIQAALQHSDDGSTGWAAVATTSTLNAAGSAVAVFKGSIKRYIRGVLTLGGSGLSINCAVSIGSFNDPV